MLLIFQGNHFLRRTRENRPPRSDNMHLETSNVSERRGSLLAAPSFASHHAFPLLLIPLLRLILLLLRLLLIILLVPLLLFLILLIIIIFLLFLVLPPLPACYPLAFSTSVLFFLLLFLLIIIFLRLIFPLLILLLLPLLCLFLLVLMLSHSSPGLVNMRLPSLGAHADNVELASQA